MSQNTNLAFLLTLLKAMLGRIYNGLTNAGTGRVTLTKRMNFRKCSKGPLTAPSFSENHVANFYQFHAQKALRKGPKSAT